MKKRLVSLFTCAAMLMQLVAMIPFFALTVSAVTNNSKMLVVSGNKLVWESDPSVVVRLTGMNVPGAGWTGNPGVEKVARSFKEAMENWSSNLIRLPVSIDGWFGDYDYIGDGGAAYRKYIDDVIAMASEAGKYVDLDLHHYTSFNNTLYLTFWQQAATIYKNNPTVLFGILNEPHGTTWDVWRNGNGSNITGHQQVVEMIRDLGAKNIIIAGGLDYSFDLRGITGRAPGDTTVYALVDQGTNNNLTKTGNGIMYDAHIYPWKGSTSNWHDKVGYVRLQYPVLIGENGFDPDDGVQKQYAPKAQPDVWNPMLFAWMNDNATYSNYANWTAWCFHPSSSPRILDDVSHWGSDTYAHPPTSYWGTYVKAQLKTDLGTDLLVGKSAEYTTSDQHYPGSNAIDGDDTSLWKCNTAGDKYITVDLGGQKSFDRWLVRNSSANTLYRDETTESLKNTRSYKLQTSSNNTDWADVDGVSGNIAGVTDRFIHTITARYVRLYVTVPAASGSELNIYSFSVFASSTPPGQVRTPVSNADSGLILPGKQITLSCATQGATIRFTTDGSTPTVTSPPYQNPITVMSDTVIKAIAYKDSMFDSEEAVFIYKIPALDSINVSGVRTTYMLKESFQYGTGKLVANYASGLVEELALDSPGVTVTRFDSEIPNDNLEITVTYKLKTTSYIIAVKTFQGLAPHGFQQMCYDDFTNTTSTIARKPMLFASNPAYPDMQIYSGGEGFSGGWTAGNGDPLKYATKADGTNPQIAFVNTNNQLEYQTSGSATPSARRLLTEPVDLSVDMDYYLVFHYQSRNYKYYSSYLQLGNAASNAVLATGEYHVGSDGGYNTATGTIYAEKTRYQGKAIMPADGSMVVSILNISARAGNVADMYRVKSFILKKGELPTFTPAGWDYEKRVPSTAANELLDRMTIAYSYGTDASYKTEMVALYKAAPVYVNKLNPSSEAAFPAYNMGFTAPGDVLTLNIPAKNVLDNSQSVQSVSWKDCTNETDPILLSEENSYTVPEDMKNRFLQCEVVLKDEDTGDIVTYYPLAEYITSEYTVEANYFTKGAGTSTTLERITSPPATTATTIGQRITVRRTNTVAARKLPANTKVKMIIAQFSSDGIIKKCVSGSSGNLGTDPDSVGTGGLIVTGLTIATGDYFRCFVFYDLTSVRPLSFNFNNPQQFICGDTRKPMN